ncbi:MAG: hypothetical protein N2490_04530 [Ignavibacteria bacterium]|nr:hypothetical protein [Ignavibacteria bacterium]
MAKAQSFADKAAKLAKKTELTAKCPVTGNETRILSVRLVEAVKTPKGTYKFLDRKTKIYESTFNIYKP